MAILEGCDGQPVLGAGMGNQLQDDLQRGEWFGPPIDGNEGKKPMLDLVPLIRLICPRSVNECVRYFSYFTSISGETSERNITLQQ